MAPYRWWHLLHRSVLGIRHADHFYAVDYDYFDWDDEVKFYRDGHQIAVGRQPNAYPVEGGQIEFATTFYGVRRAHLVLTGGAVHALSPDPKSPEAWRKRLAERHRVVSSLIAVAAVLVLVGGLVVGSMALIETLTHTEVAEPLGWSFSSPVELTGAVATAWGVAGVLAVAERAVSMRHHWLLDADTWWMD